MPIKLEVLFKQIELGEQILCFIKRYFPKGADFMTLSKDEVQTVIVNLNHCPRKHQDIKAS